MIGIKGGAFEMETVYMSAKEAAAEWNMPQKRVVLLCAEGKITDAVLHENVWLIPKTAQERSM